MAGKTKNTAKIKVDKTKASISKTEESSGDSCAAYLLLRNVLDGVQYASLDYYGKGESDQEKKERADKLKTILLSAYTEICKLPNAKVLENCYPCGEVCLPFPCP